MDVKIKKRSPDTPAPPKIYARAAAISALTLVLLPVANAMTLSRRSGGVNLGFLDPLLSAVFACALFVTLIATFGTRKIGRLSGTHVVQSALLFVIGIAFLVNDDVAQLRDVILIVLSVHLFALAIRRGVELIQPALFGYQIAALASVCLYFVNPNWYINASPYFLDSGKIIALLPNMQGLLTHPNYTGLYFATALVIQAVAWKPGKPRQIFWLLLFAALTVSTQARGAIIGAILAVATVILVRRGRRASASILATATSVIAFAPFMIMLSSAIRGARPDFGVLSALGTRQGLWNGVYDALFGNLLALRGSKGIEEARTSVTDSDVVLVTHAHNEVLSLALVGGALAILLFAAWTVSVLIQIFFTHSPGGASLMREQAAPLILARGLFALFIFTCLSETPLAGFFPQAGTVVFILLAAAAAQPPVVAREDVQN